MKKLKRVIASLLCMLMLLQPVAFAASVADFLDFPNGWSKDAMTAAVENGLYIGNESKLIQPDKALTRAELAAFITRAFGATRTADISRLTDVSADDWFYLPVAKAYQMGALTGTSDTTFDPSSYITREQVFLVLARVLCISGTNEKALEKFTDAAQISSWAKNGVIGMVEKGYVNGYPNGSFRPQDNITRAELAQVFHNIFKTYIDEPGYYSQVADGSVMIRVPGVHLENVTVNGDIVIADGVANGDFDLSAVNVTGRVLARGGEGKVTFKSVTVGEKVVIYDLNGTVNFNNYRTDAPFKNLDEITPATFLKKPETTDSGSSSTGGGGGSKNSYYTVRFLDEDGTKIENVRVSSGNTVTAPDAPIKAHYTFVYWSLEKDGEEFDLTTKVTKNFALYAVYKRNPVVTFYVDSAVWGTKQEIAYNGTVAEPTDIPEKTGHTFAYWADKDGNEFDFTNTLTKNTDLYAVFTVNKYDVIFYEKEYGTTGTNPEHLKLLDKAYGSEVTKDEFPEPPASPDTSKKFVGWSLDGTTITIKYPYEASYVVGTENKLYPVFSDKATYTVSFVADGATVGTQTVIDGNYASAIAAPAKEGHTFKYWSATENGAEFDFAGTPITAALTLYAVYEKNSYTVTFYTDDTCATTFHTEDVAYEETVSAPATTPAAPSGMEFSHWALRGTTAEVTFPYTVTGATEFVPVFTPIGKVLVTFMANGTEYASVEVTKGDTVSAPATNPTFAGHSFKYWSLTNGGEAFDFSTPITSATTLYAVFAVNSYTVTFYTDDTCTAKHFEKTDATYGTIINESDVPALTPPAGKHFAYWVVRGTTTEISFPYTITDNAEFVPVFTDKDVFTVTFIVDGTTYATKSVIDGDAIGTNMPADPTIEHTAFLGWYTEENGAGTKVDADTVITGDLTVYAYLKSELLTVSFYSINKWNNGDEPLLKVIQIPYGMSLNELIASDPTVVLPDNTVTEGFKRNSSIASIYGTLGIDDCHKLTNSWWLVNGGKWEELNMDAAITENKKVYENYKEAKLIVSLPKVSSIPLTLYAPYDSDTRVIDTVKDALFISESTVKTALTGKDGDKLLAQMEKRGVIDADRNILNQHRFIKLVTVLGRSNIEKLIGGVVDDSINSDDSKQYIYDYIEQYMDKIKADQDKAVTVLTPVFNDILSGSSANSFRAVLQSIVDEAVAPGAVTIGTSVDEATVRKIVEYISDDANVTYRDALTDTMFKCIDGETLIKIAADLGQTEASNKTAAINQLIDELCDEDNTKVTVTADRLFMFEPIYKLLEEHGWDFIESKIPAKLKNVLPLDDVKTIFDRHYNAYVGSMKAAMDAAEADPTGTFYIENGIEIQINPISDVLTPALEYVKDMKAYAEDKASKTTREEFVKYYPYYENNPFKDAYEEFLVTDKWVSGSDLGYTGELSGYKLYSLDKYYDIVKSLTVVLDDTMSWYYDDENVPAADREAVFDIAEDKALAIANMLRNFMVDYAVNGIPTTLKDLCLSIESDPTMIKIINKLGVSAYLEKLEDNATAGKVYDTVYDKINARFGARIESILDRLYESKFNRYYDEAEYEKAKEILHGLFDAEGDIYTVDTIFDNFFDGADQKSEEFNGITVEILRHIFYPVEMVEELETDLGI